MIVHFNKTHSTVIADASNLKTNTLAKVEQSLQKLRELNSLQPASYTWLRVKISGFAGYSEFYFFVSTWPNTA